jgi:hypothetical protein
MIRFYLLMQKTVRYLLIEFDYTFESHYSRKGSIYS